MDIELKFKSPASVLPNLGKDLEMLATLQQRLDALRGPGRIDFSITGLESLARNVNLFNEIAARLGAIGESKFASSIQSGAVSAGAAIDQMRAKATEMRAELERVQATHSNLAQTLKHAGKDSAESYAFFGDLRTKKAAEDKMRDIRAEMEKTFREMQSLTGKLQGLDDIVKLAEAWHRAGGEISKAVEPMAQAAQNAATHAQAAAADAKATAEQAAAHEALAKAKAKSAGPGGTGAGGGGLATGGPVIRTVAGEQGPVSVTRYGGRGVTTTDTGEVRTTTDVLAKYRALEREIEARFAQAGAGMSGRDLAGMRRRQAEVLRQLAGDDSLRFTDLAGGPLEIMGLGGAGLGGSEIATGFLRKAASLEGRAFLAEQGLSEREIAQAERREDRSTRATMRLRGQLHRDAQREQRARDAEEKKNNDATLRRNLALAADREREEKGREREEQKNNDATLRLRQQLWRDEQREKARAEKEAERARKASVGGIFTQLPERLVKVAGWGLGVGALYSGIDAVKSGFTGAMHVEREQAMLAGILGVSPGQARGLTSQVLGIAGEQGRGAEEAMAAAMKFAHMPLTKGNIGGFTNLSMKAANVAGIGGEEAAHAVASYTEAFHMGIGQATSALDQMNSVANQTNTTVKELLEAMARMGPIAKTTGFDVAQLSALLAGGAGKTGLPLTQFTQAFGMMLTNSTDASRQNTLRTRFGLDVFRPDGAMMSGPELLSAVHRRYSQMSPQQGLAMLSTFGGARQGQRLAAILDNYDESQALAVTALRDKGSADRANRNILDTTSARAARVGTAWKEMWSDAHQGGLKNLVNWTLDAAPPLLNWVDNRLGEGTTFVKAAYNELMNSHSPWESGSAKNTKRPPGFRATFEDYAQGRADREFAGKIGQQIKRLETEYGQEEASGNANRMALSRFHEMRGDLDGLTGEARTKKLQGLGIVAGVGKEGFQGLSGRALNESLDAAYERLAKAAKESADAQEKIRDQIMDKLQMIISDHWNNIGQGGPKSEAGRAAEAEKAKAALRSLSSHGKMSALAALEMPVRYNREDQTAQERLGSLFGGVDSFFGSVPMGSHWQVDAVRRQQEHLSAKRGMLSAFNARYPNVPTTEQDYALRMEGFSLDRAQQAAPLMDDVRRGEMRMHRVLGGYGTGMNESEQMLDMIRGIGGQAMGSVARRNLPGFLGGNAAQAAGESLTQRMQLEQAYNTLLTRRETIQREINNLKIAENMESARALGFASRGDQLTAALLAKRLQTKGKFSPEEFMVLSDETRRAAAAYMPGVMPDSLRGNGINRLVQEQGMLPGMVAEADARRKMLNPILQANSSLAGLAPVSLPPVNVTLGAEFSQLADSLAAATRAGVQADIAAIATRVDIFIAEMTARHPQGVGADTAIPGI